MAGGSPTERAFRRLAAALAELERAADRRIATDREKVDVETEAQRLGADRSRLAQSLDAAEARASRLEEANREVSRRLVAAMESIRAVVERHSA